jgi:hypothetical protein
MLNVKYAISSDSRILKLKDHMPRAFFVREAVTMPSEKVLDFMMSEDFDPKKMVVFENTQLGDRLSSLPIGPRGKQVNDKDHRRIFEDDSEGFQIIEYGNTRIDLRVSTNHDGYLILSEINYPGWTAYVNGRKATLLTGNYIFRVLPLSKGDYDIVIRFEPTSFKIGLMISGGTVFFFVLVLVSAHVRKKIKWSIQRKNTSLSG